MAALVWFGRRDSCQRLCDSGVSSMARIRPSQACPKVHWPTLGLKPRLARCGATLRLLPLQPLGGSMNGLRFFWLLPALVLSAADASALSLDGEKTISLVDQKGDHHTVASVVFTPEGNGSTYDIEWRDDAFADHFLSMRPFKCLEGTDKHWCRVPYPYEIRRMVSDDDLTDLEYDLLFVWKGATEYGINLWNGVYYKLENQDGRLSGTLFEMDMDKLGVPPETGNLRPIREVDLEEGYPESHWLPRLVIE